MLDFAWSLGGFIVAIGVLVAFHEFGHYWVARRCGVKVLRYSIGFGRPLWKRRARDGVEWMISAVPLGGYVKMLDEREGPVAPAERAQAFNNATVWRRMAIVAAGPVFNFMLAVALYWLVFVLGVQGLKPVLAAPPENSIAARAGLREGEQVLKIDDTRVPTWTVLRTELIDRALDGGALQLRVRGTDGQERDVQLDLHNVRVDPEFLFADLGLDSYQPPIPPVIGEVLRGEAGEAAGLKAGDRVLAINGSPIPSWQALVKWVRAHPAEVASIEVQRAGERLTLKAIIGRGPDAAGKLGAGVTPPADLWQHLRAENRLGPGDALPAAVAETWLVSKLTVKFLWRIVVGDVSVKNISGPIQIAQATGFSAQLGLAYFLSTLAIISVSLGVLNLLPVPMLDGGHLLYYAIEAVKGSPLSDRLQEAGARVGLTLLVALMGLAFYNDIVRLFS
ncbi:MAG TPA: RIP metalloprotease RseP [Solimonas sp.]|nr:RIP metalloprotease RseP [Solimonas sp.]